MNKLRRKILFALVSLPILAVVVKKNIPEPSINDIEVKIDNLVYYEGFVLNNEFVESSLL